MACITVRWITHSKRVCTLYKNALRCLESWYDRRDAYRYRAVLLRKRFDELKCLTDQNLAALYVEEGEKELFNSQHYQPRRFQFSPGGCAYDRETLPIDWVLDYWHPLEKALYPEFFATREHRKKHYIETWNRQHGPYELDDDHH